MADPACPRCTNPLPSTHPACPHCSGPKARKGDQGGLSLGEHLRALAVERIECSDCDGSGNVAARGHEPCWRCGGSGQVSRVDLQKLHDQIAAAKADAQRAREEGAREVAEVKAWGQRQADEARGLREEAGALLLALSPGKLLDPRDWIEGVGSAASRLRALLVASKASR